MYIYVYMYIRMNICVHTYIYGDRMGLYIDFVGV